MLSLVRRRHHAILAIMLSFGIVFSSWVTRTPAVKSAIDASTAQMGIILFGISVGSMIGIFVSGPLIRKFGTRWVLTLGLGLAILGITTTALASGAGSAIPLFFGLAFLGGGNGVSDIALNVEGAAIEKVSDKPILPALHGCFSLGTVIGSVIALVLTSIDFPVMWHLLGASVLMLLIALWSLPKIPSGDGIVESTKTTAKDNASKTQQKLPSVWRDNTLKLVAVIILATAFAEGSANDWLPILIVDTHGASAALGSLVFTGFAITMTLGRFIGGPIVAKFGQARTLQFSMILAIVGVSGVIFAPSVAFAAGFVVLWGLGSALGFPVAISAAAASDDRSAQRVTAVTSGGYFAFLVGPPLLGFIGENKGLTRALFVVVGLLVLAFFAATILQGITSKHRRSEPVGSVEPAGSVGSVGSVDIDVDAEATSSPAEVSTRQQSQ